MRADAAASAATAGVLGQILPGVQILQAAVGILGLGVDFYRQWQLAKTQAEIALFDAQRREWWQKHQALEADINRQIALVADPKNEGQVKESKTHYRRIIKLLGDGVRLLETELRRLQGSLAPSKTRLAEIERHLSGNWEYANPVAAAVGTALIFPLIPVLDAIKTSNMKTERTNLLAAVATNEALRLETQLRSCVFYNMQASYSFNLGLCYFEQRKYQKALTAFNQAFSAAERSGEESLKVQIRNNRAAIYSEMAAHEKAAAKRLEYSTLAIADLRESLDTRVNQALYRAYWHYERGEYAVALTYSNEDLRLARRRLDDIVDAGEVRGLILRGRIQQKTGAHADAIVSFRHAMHLLPDQFSNREERENLWMLCAASYRVQGNFIEMRNCYREAACLNLRNREALLPLAAYEENPEVGDAQAQAYLGYSYIEKYINAVVDVGNVRAQPTTDESAQARKWLGKSEAQQNLLGKNWLAVMDSLGFGAEKNEARAKAVFEELDAAGFAKASLNLGLFYLMSVPQNLDEALRYCTKAAETGLVEAEYQLGMLYSYWLPAERQNPGLGKIYLTRAAEKDFVVAKVEKGLLHLRENTKPAAAEAMKLFKSAAKHGNPDGLYYYAESFLPADLRQVNREPGIANDFLRFLNKWFNTFFDKPNLTKAIALLKAADSYGHVRARTKLAELRTAGHAGLIDSTSAYEPPHKRPPLLLEGERGGFQFEVRPVPVPEPAPAPREPDPIPPVAEPEIREPVPPATPSRFEQARAYAASWVPGIFGGSPTVNKRAATDTSTPKTEDPETDAANDASSVPPPNRKQRRS